eukprot:11809098-Prorocentrum_lima.AAC.1
MIRTRMKDIIRMHVDFGRLGGEIVTVSDRLESGPAKGPPYLLDQGIGLGSRYVPYIPRYHIKLGHGSHKMAV